MGVGGYGGLWCGKCKHHRMSYKVSNLDDTCLFSNIMSYELISGGCIYPLDSRIRRVKYPNIRVFMYGVIRLLLFISIPYSS